MASPWAVAFQWAQVGDAMTCLGVGSLLAAVCSLAFGMVDLEIGQLTSKLQDPIAHTNRCISWFARIWTTWKRM